jgi:hypothetical protein
VWTRLGWGLLLTVTQVVLVSLLSGQSSPASAYRSLARWDSGWYEHIVENGYVCPAQQTKEDFGNVAFFPGYPLAVRLIKDAFGLDTQMALLATAWLACWGFWSYVLLLWQRWQVSLPGVVVGVLAILTHPAAFYLVCGYSESLFLMSALGFLFWAGNSSHGGFLLAALHGFWMTMTRLVGLPLVGVPLLAGLAAEKGKGRLPALFRLSLLAGLSSLGAGLFFLWCHFHFGRWDLYQQTEIVGWDNRADYFCVLNWRIYVFKLWPLGWWTNSCFWGRVMVPATTLLLAGLLWCERPRGGVLRQGWPLRLALYLGAFMVFYISLAMTSPKDFDSLVRYHLVVHVLLVMAAVHLLVRMPKTPWALRVLLVLVALGAFVGQCYFAYRFTHDFWVA